jgi:predicted lipoprotein
LFILPIPAFATNLSDALLISWHAPRAAAFAEISANLAPAIQSLCEATPGQSAAALDNARRRWTASLSSWERLAGVAIGPVLERRSQRAIDFTPTRPRMIEKAIKSAPKTPAEMELIGTPAKGLPALEWLLWVKPVQPASPACAYAVLIAKEVAHEAAALAGAKPAVLDDATVLSELVNQWVGGIERLRWPGMEMPLRVAMTATPPADPDYPRRDSGAAAVAWAAQWDALRTLATQGDASLHALLRARGQAKVAEALTVAVDEVDAAMTGLAGGDKDRILLAAKGLAALKHRVEAEVAPALGVSIGFSDADGD